MCVAHKNLFLIMVYDRYQLRLYVTGNLVKIIGLLPILHIGPFTYYKVLQSQRKVGKSF